MGQQILNIWFVRRVIAKGVIRIHKSKKNRQRNNQKKRDKITNIKILYQLAGNNVQSNLSMRPPLLSSHLHWKVTLSCRVTVHATTSIKQSPALKGHIFLPCNKIFHMTHEVTSIKQSHALKGHFFLSCDKNIPHKCNLVEEVTFLKRPLFLCLKGDLLI